MSDLSWMHIRLAELCGINLRTDSKLWATWSPTTDVAQAVRCADALRERDGCSWSLRHGSMYAAKIEDQDEPQAEFADTAARALCLAISQALGWTEEAAERGER